MSIGLVGAGRMAQALARGIIKSGFTSPEKVIASAHIQDLHHLKEFENMGCRTTTSNAEVARESDVIVLAVKPVAMQQVLTDVSPEVKSSRHLLVSVALGVILKTMERALPIGSRVIRTMPNTPCVVAEGATVFSVGAAVSPSDTTFVASMFSCVGTCEQVPESYLDAVTALSGSGPAYVYLVIEALTDGGVKMGLPRDISLRLATQTVLGSAKMVKTENRHPAALRDDVTSPGGCTSHALHVLEQGGARALFVSAVQEATRRVRELGAQTNNS